MKVLGRLFLTLRSRNLIQPGGRVNGSGEMVSEARWGGRRWRWAAGKLRSMSWIVGPAKRLFSCREVFLPSVGCCCIWKAIYTRDWRKRETDRDGFLLNFIVIFCGSERERGCDRDREKAEGGEGTMEDKLRAGDQVYIEEKRNPKIHAGW